MRIKIFFLLPALFSLFLSFNAVAKGGFDITAKGIAFGDESIDVEILRTIAINDMWKNALKACGTHSNLPPEKPIIISKSTSTGVNHPTIYEIEGIFTCR